MPASRYELLVKIGAGGTASVHIARVTGPAAFSRLVAVKRPHPHILGDPAAYRSFVAEAAIASKIHHANVVAVLDVEAGEDDLRLVMDYIEGVSLAELLDAGAAGGAPLPVEVALKIVLDAAAGLAAVHALQDERGRSLGILHRDVSPQNILVGIDGTARLSDLGLARPPSSRRSEANGALMGKLAYLAPERIDSGVASAQSDLFALGVVAWEALSGARLFRGRNEIETLERLRTLEPEPLSRVVPELGPCLDEAIRKALHKDPSQRWASVRDFAEALGEAARANALMASSTEVGDHVRAAAEETLKRRRELLRSCGGDATTGLRSTQTAPLVEPPAPRPRASLLSLRSEPEAREPSIAEDLTPEPDPFRTRSLSTRARLAGLAVSLGVLALAARLWMAGSATEEVSPSAPQPLLPAPVAAAEALAPALPSIAPVEPPAPSEPPRRPAVPRRDGATGRPRHAERAVVQAAPSANTDLGF